MKAPLSTWSTPWKIWWVLWSICLTANVICLIWAGLEEWR